MRTLLLAGFSLLFFGCAASPAPPSRVEEPVAPKPTASATTESKEDDTEKTRATFDASCKERKDLDACAFYAIMAARGVGGPKDERGAATAVKSGCAGGSGSSCVALGAFARRGVGMERDAKEAKSAFRRGCDLGENAGCRALREMENDAGEASNDEKPAPTPKSSLSASSMTVDGTSFASLTCDLGGGGGLLGPIAIAKGVSLQKSALDACVKKPTETPIEVTSSGGAFAKVKATGPDASVNRCVERALKGKQAAIAGTCTMTVQHGR